MKAPERIDLLLLVHAYCDGELDPVTARAIERQIALRPELAAEQARIEMVRTMLQGWTGRAPAAAGFFGQRMQQSRGRFATALAACAVLTCGLTWFIAAQATPDLVLQELAASHTRALLAARVTDVASSDRHTVKPWLSARAAVAPRVVDLAADGYPLLGGRLDIVRKIPVATLIYGERQHVLSLTALPLSATRASPSGLSQIDGLNAYGWAAGDVAYWVISDVDPASLEEFASRFRRD